MQEEQQPTTATAAAAATTKDVKNKPAESSKAAASVKAPPPSVAGGGGGGAAAVAGGIEGRVQTARKLTQRLVKASAESRFNKEDVLEALRRVSKISMHGQAGSCNSCAAETIAHQSTLRNKYQTKQQKRG